MIRPRPIFALLRRSYHVDKKIKELGFVIPQASTPKGNYSPCMRTGNLIFTSGHLPQDAEGVLLTGKVGQDFNADEGYNAAHLVAMQVLTTLKSELGDLDKIKRVVKVVGFVNCTDDFTSQPQVINGFSDTMVKVFGDRGIHARSAVGTNSLPLNIPVEVEVIVEVEDWD